jgi:CheY-like chemotaxis protein
MNGIEKMLRRLIGSDVEFKVLPASTLQSVRVDPGQIEQLIMNLAANARDAMPRGGKLTIATTNTHFQADAVKDGFDAPPGPYVVLSVSDTGMGMDAATQARMFEPFFTTKPVGKGTGLGLSTVYGITKQSSGYIKVQSAPGKGTTFQIFFPAIDQAAAPHPVVQQSHQSNRGTETVLVVEDEPKIADVIATTLTRRGYEVLVANNGSDAEQFAAKHAGPIHIMLIDVVMPKPSGREIADRISALRPEICVLWMSGYTDDTIVRHGILEPGLNFLQKPFTPAVLAEKIREICDKHPAEKA